MTLKLDNISQTVAGQVHLYPLDMALAPHAVTVLLGATLAGKTSLMRLMAGLDLPSTGQVWVDGQDVTGVAVRERNVAMVYQQFINYPSMTVYDNIASPLRLRGDSQIDEQVQAMAKRLRIDPFLGRLPAELSGGQQQRVALARALAKRAPLMFLDEPLVNLDYKLREELREDLTQLFEAGSGTVVYATTEPSEALIVPCANTAFDQTGKFISVRSRTSRMPALEMALGGTLPGRRSCASMRSLPAWLYESRGPYVCSAGLSSDSWTGCSSAPGTTTWLRR